MMPQVEITEKLASILCVEADSLDTAAPLHTLGLDSMRMVEVIVFIEQTYGIDLMGSGLKQEDVSSISALARTVENLKSQ
jgi:acyl carrier protein